MSIKKLELDLKKKSCAEPFSVKDSSAGVFIEGFANKATVDRGAEMIATDAWELDNYKRNPIILFNHGKDALGGTPVGKATDIRQTDQGLYLKVKMSNSQSPAIKMVRDLVEERILKAFSVGFNPKEAANIDVEGKSVRKITKAELFEVSIVGVPMNQDSLFELSEKSLTTKSFTQLKREILLARKAEAAERVEVLLATSPSRRDVIAAVAKSQKIDVEELLDMLSGEKELPREVELAFPAAIKVADLKQTLEEALSALADGADEAAVATELMTKLEGGDDEEAEPAEEVEPAQSGEAEKEGDGEEKPAPEDEGDEAADAGEAEAPPEDIQRKADFQDCVNATVPKLIQEGMEQDQAVAAAISKCQESGKCNLTQESKMQIFKQFFELMDKNDAFDMPNLLPVLSFKEDAPPAPAPEEEGEDEKEPEQSQDEVDFYQEQVTAFLNKVGDKVTADENPKATFEENLDAAIAELEAEMAAADTEKSADCTDCKSDDEDPEDLEEMGGPGSGPRPGGGRGGKNPKRVFKPIDFKVPGYDYSKKKKTDRQTAVNNRQAEVRLAKCMGQTINQHRRGIVSRVFKKKESGAELRKVLVKTLRGCGAKVKKSWKNVAEQEQANQAPTTPIKTDDSPENFGSPFLEAAKQTNVLLGALINEFQKLSSKLDGISSQSSVPSKEEPPAKGQEDSSETENHAQKRLDSLNQRLKNLGF